MITELILYQPKSIYRFEYKRIYEDNYSDNFTTRLVVFIRKNPKPNNFFRLNPRKFYPNRDADCFNIPYFTIDRDHIDKKGYVISLNKNNDIPKKIKIKQYRKIRLYNCILMKYRRLFKRPDYSYSIINKDYV